MPPRPLGLAAVCATYVCGSTLNYAAKKFFVASRFVVIMKAVLSLYLANCKGSSLFIYQRVLNPLIDRHLAV